METEVTKPVVSPVNFTGKGGEFFGIWFVNVALSILTLGIYSAWAKVRTKRYFYGNTRIADHSFEYLATGGQILKSRLLAVFILIVYNVLASISLTFALVLLVLFMIAVPWLMISGLRFNARVSAYRNVRFDFSGRYGEAFMALFVWPLIGMLTLGILMPKAVQKSAKFVVTNHSYGDEKFSFRAEASDYKPVIYGLLIGYLVTMIMIVVGAAYDIAALSIIGVVALYAVALSVKPLVFNIYWNHVRIRNNGFVASMPVGRWIWIFLSNSLVVGLTLGLMYPWSKVRLAKFTADSMQFVDAKNIDRIISTQTGATNAAGEELSEAFDVDLGFGV